MQLSGDRAIDHVARRIGKGPRRYRARAQFLFEGIPLDGRRVLDVGCGPGTYALWAAIHDADYVLGIEPESDGSTGGALAQFRSIAGELDVHGTVRCESALLEDLDAPAEPFDVVLMYNVINHLDEDAVGRLHEDPAAVDRFTDRLAILPRLVRPGGTLIVADCGRRNFWGDRGLRSPVTPSIEWDKHQEPEVWVSVLERLGFELRDLRWSPWFPFGPLSSNRRVQYLTASHFVLRLRYRGADSATST